MPEKLASPLVSYQGQRGKVIPLLQQAQAENGYLSEEEISEIANSLGLTKNEVYGVATFYAHFRFERPAKHQIKVYECPAFYLKGGKKILETLEQELGIQPGETTEDNQFGLEKHPCFGECASAPVMEIDDTFYIRLTPARVKEILAQYQRND